MENLKKHIKEQKIQLYKPSAKEDLRLLHLWDTLRTSGEVNDITQTKDFKTPSGFLAVFQSPAIAFYTTHDSGEIDWFVYFKPGEGNYSLNIHVDKRERMKLKSIIKLGLVLRIMFEQTSIIVAYTHDEKIAKLHRKGGLHPVGIIPLENERELYISSLNRKQFTESTIFALSERSG